MNGNGSELDGITGEYILLAEDDEDDVTLLKSFLREVPESPEILVINKGDKVISFFESLPGNRLPRLIILDYNLPSVSGYEILIALSEDKKYRNVPKIIWSTSNSPHFESLCMAKGAVAYFVKPSDITGFQSLVQQLQLILSVPQ